MKKSKLTVLLDWGARQGFIVQVVVILISIPVLLFKKLNREARRL